MEMSGTDISNLSYKELQALALRYRVPGNIKKQLLIEVLQAARCGNEQEVDKLLSDLRQTRKKRIRRGKSAKLNLSSTPIHSPTYDMADDNYYNAQHRLPYQWVGAEEEIPNRQDDPNRIPQYEEFRQFLLRRIQRDYQTYGGNNIERVNPGDPGGPGGLMDLRNESDSIRFDTEQVGMRSSIVPTNGLESAHSYSEQLQGHNGGGFDYQILEDPNENGHASILLRRMLQAPAGADLGEIASPEMARTCRIWPTEYQQGQNNVLDNSDTLSANSEINDNEETWPNGAEYYRFVNNVRDQLILNPTSGPVPCNRTFYDQSTTTTTEQFSGVVTAEGNPVEYQLVYANQIPDVQQPWEATNSVDNAAAYETEQQTLTQYQNLKNYASSYATPRPLETDPLQLAYPGGEDAATAGVVYPRNENGLEDQPVDDCNPSAVSRTEIKFYQNLNTAATGRQLDEANGNFNFARSSIISTSNYNAGIDQTIQQPSAGFMPPMQHLSFSSTPQITEQEFNRPSVLIGQYDNRQEHNTLMMQKLNAVVEAQEFPEGEQRNSNRNKTVTTATIEPHVAPLSLEPFWPERSASKNPGDSNQLENILNLKAYGYVDYSKIDQTSCIYCYAAPIVTQKTFTGSSSCSQKRRFIAEFRQHTFSPYWLLYSDAKTGMQMSKHVKVIDKTTERQETEQLQMVHLDFEGPQNAQVHHIADDSPFQVESQQLPAELIARENSMAKIDPKFCSLAPTDEGFPPIARSDTNDGEKTQALIIDSDKEATATTENGNRFDQNGNCNLVTGN